MIQTNLDQRIDFKTPELGLSAVSITSGLVVRGRVHLSKHQSRLISDSKYLFDNVFLRKISQDSCDVLYQINKLAVEKEYKKFPSRKEICKVTNFSDNRLQLAVNELIKKGLIHLPEKGKAGGGYILTKKGLNPFLTNAGRRAVKGSFSVLDSRVKLLKDIIDVVIKSESPITKNGILDQLRNSRNPLPDACGKYVDILRKWGIFSSSRKGFSMDWIGFDSFFK